MSIRQIAERAVGEGLYADPTTVEEAYESLIECMALFGPQRIDYRDGSTVYAMRYYS